MKKLSLIVFLLLILPSPISAQERDANPFPLPELEVISAENAARLANLGTLEGFTDWLVHAAFSPDGSMVAATGYGNVMRIWNVQTGELLVSIECPELLEFSAMGGAIFIPNSSWIALACNSDIVFWDIDQLINDENSSPVFTLSLVKQYPYHIVTDSEGRFIAARDIGSINNKIWLWNLQTRENIFFLQSDSCLCCLNFSPNGQYFAYTDDIETHLVDLGTLEEVDTIPRSQAFSMDWSLSATTDPQTSLIHLRQTESDDVPLILENHVNHLPSLLSFSPDGGVLASGSEYYRMVLWDTSTGELLANIDTCCISSMTFSPDSKLILTTHASDGGGYPFRNVLWGVPVDEG